MKEFLNNLYHTCAAGRTQSGVDQLFQVLPALLGERLFKSVNDILIQADLQRLDTSSMYAMVHLICNYIHQLPDYRNFYQRVREEYARRGEPSNRIASLFDKYENGGNRLFDPNAPPHDYRSHEEKFDEKLSAKIVWAKSLGDKDLEDMLTFYQAERTQREEKERTFKNLERVMGEKEMRKKTIQALREMADLLDENIGCWPGIYYCSLPEDPSLKRTFIDRIEVVISYPWPG